MIPRRVFVLVWRLADGHTVPMLTTEASYNHWRLAPDAYTQKRLSRYNKHRPARMAPAVGLVIHPFSREGAQ